jgi:hypothetical protein
MDYNSIKVHMEVIGADGIHIGTDCASRIRSA